MTKKTITSLILNTLAAAVLLPVVAAASDADGFKSLFNGKDLTGWDGNPELWSVQDGAIVGQTTREKPTKGNTFLIWQGGDLKDFELHASVKIESGNSGVQYRSKNLGTWAMAGYQCDVRTPAYDRADPKNCTGKIYSEREGRGQMAFGGEKAVYNKDGKKEEVGQVNEVEKITKALDQDQWQELVIIAKGNRIVQKVNGETVCELTDEEEAKRALSGQLGLQIHAGNPMKVSFKDVQLKELK
jgi:hypothetical protein